jgi:hypothetical protein
MNGHDGNGVLPRGEPPGIDPIKLHFGRKSFRTIFLSDKMSRKH